MNLNRLTKRDLLMNHVSAYPIAHMLLENRQLIEDDPTDRLGLGFLGVDDGLRYDGDLLEGAIVVTSPAEETEDPGRLVPPHGSGP